MRLKKFLENKINNKEITWDNKSQLIKASGEKVNGNNIKILKIYEKKFKFGSVQKIKDQEILKYFSKQPKNSFISVEGAKKIINENLPKNITEKPKGEVSTTLIYSRLNDPKFNKNNLKGQTIDNQVSKFKDYDVKLSDRFLEKVFNLREQGIYLSIEETSRGSKTIRLKTSENYGNLNNTFKPNEDSIKEIKKIINEQKK